jgi:hypothetical protein
MTAPAEWTSGLIGKSFVKAELENSIWHFEFEPGAKLTTPGPWRIVADSRVVLADCDHGQTFGNARTFDCLPGCINHLQNKRVTGVDIRQDTGDLTVRFADTSLEVINPSAAHEGWNLRLAGRNIIALGGGELTTF